MLRRLGTVLTLAVSAAVLYFDPTVIGGVVALFVLVVPFEKLFPRHAQKVRREGLGIDLAYAITQPVLGAIGIVVAAIIGIGSLVWLPALALSPLVARLPGAARLVVGLLLFDLLLYWAHRFAHEVPFMWRFHAIHHSTAKLDWISGFRSHPFDGVLLAPGFIFLLAAGFDPQFTGALAVVQILLGLFLHANVRWKLRWLQKVVMTPEFHHWHHTNRSETIHTNYATFLPVWDLVFGTYFGPRNDRPDVYGVDEEVPNTVVGQLVHPLRGLVNPATVLRHPVVHVRLGAGLVRRGLGQMARTARRPRHNVLC